MKTAHAAICRKNKNDKRFPVSENLLTNQKMVAIIETKSIRRLDMVERKEYLKKLIAWKDEQVIKVVTGIRRCGKSTLLKLYKNYLRITALRKTV